MRRVTMPRRDRGAAALIVTAMISGMLLLGVAAMTVDVGQWMGERRSLQNGADATALALAKRCANSLASCSWAATGADLTSLNNSNGGSDGVSTFNTLTYPNGVCQNNLVSTVLMPNCVPAGSTDCMTAPSWLTSSTKYVETHTLTQTLIGTNRIAPVFGQALGENDGGKIIGACARVALLPVTGGTVLPLTFSLCEWNNFVPTPSKIVPPPPYTSGYPSNPATFGNFPTYEHTIFLHDTSGSAHCNAGPSGADLPGGFGWLTPDSGCLVHLSEGNWIGTSTGGPPPASCSLFGLLNKVLLLPVYDQTNGLTGSNIQYHVDFFAAFYLTGYRVASDPEPSSATGNICLPSQTCLLGWFTSGLVPAGEVDYSGSGADTGVLAPVTAG
jgi:Flp pilus assembly protein TadG